jgi:hypothetical protein
MDATLASLSRSLSRLDNARAYHVTRAGYSADVARRARKLEERALATRSAADLAAVESFVTELYRGAL